MQGPSSLIATTIVQAGAGTGKTESLARRIIEVAELIQAQKNATPRFVATTFTERATSELRERVVSILSKRNDAPAWLVEFVQDPQDLHISTIHGTLALVLHRFGTLMGLDPEFTILREGDERQMLSRILRDLISSHDEFGALLENYAFFELVEAVRDLISHCRLHGGRCMPAKGWQNVMGRQRQELFKHLENLSGVSPNDLSPKFGEKVSRLQALLPRLKEAGDDFEKLRQVFLAGMEGIDKRGLSDKAGAHVKDAVGFACDLKSNFWGEDTYDPLINKRFDEDSGLLMNLVNLASTRLNDEKLERGVLSFDDLEFLALELVENHREALYAIQREWDFWFVDEYQDTSPLQKKLLFHFFRLPWNAYFVGDPQQSIYLFRGADEHVFQNTRAMIEQNRGRLENLETNYRSQPDLLKFMNLLFTTMRTPMQALKAKAEYKGETRAQVTRVGKDVDENKVVLDQILNWRDQGHSFHEMAVLVRTNDKARNMAQVLSAAGVPVYIHTSGGYYDRREVLDALGLLSVLEDPSDDDTFILVARSPWVHVEDQILAEWGLSRGKMTYWDFLRENPQQIDRVRTLKLLYEAIRKAETRPLSTVFETLIDELGLMEFCLAGDASGRREANLRKLLYTLREAEATAGFSAAAFLENAWRELIEPSEEGEAASFIEPQRVNIMTIHKSKGLKFNCVAIPYCGDAPRASSGLLELSPDGRWAIRVLAIEAEQKVAPVMHEVLKEERHEREMAEHNRVFYVAVTRAAEKLALIGKAEAKEGSWFSQLTLSVSEGRHGDSKDHTERFESACYNVSVLSEDPQERKYIDETRQEIARELVLPESQPRKTHRLTVTQLVGARARTNAPASTVAAGLAGATEGLRGLANGNAPIVTPVASVTAQDVRAQLKRFKGQIQSQQLGQALHEVFERIHLTGDDAGSSGSEVLLKGEALPKREALPKDELQLKSELLADREIFLSGELKRVCEVAMGRYGLDKAIDEATILKTIALQVPPLRELIVRGQREWPFVFRENDVFVRGQIDLWGEVGDRTWIVDYKSIREFSPEAVAKATAQLEIYALAIHKLGVPWEKIDLAMVSPLKGEGRAVPKRSLVEVSAEIKPMPVDSWGEAEI